MLYTRLPTLRPDLSPFAFEVKERVGSGTAGYQAESCLYLLVTVGGGDVGLPGTDDGLPSLTMERMQPVVDFLQHHRACSCSKVATCHYESIYDHGR